MYNLFKRLYYKLLAWLTAGKGMPVTINGFRFRLPARYYRLFPADYEQSSFRFIKEKLKSGDTVLDIGAHIGIFSVYFSRLSGGKVFSFEPARETALVLKETIRINDCANAFVMEGAISGEPGKAVFYTSQTEEIATGNSLLQVETARDYIRKAAYEVPVYTVDGFAKEKGIRVNFIKIDAEGVEREVLKGAAATFLNDRPHATLGLHPFTYEQKEKELQEIWQMLSDYRMQVFLAGRPLGREEFCSQVSGLFDVELVPAESLT